MFLKLFYWSTRWCSASVLPLPSAIYIFFNDFVFVTEMYLHCSFFCKNFSRASRNLERNMALVIDVFGSLWEISNHGSVILVNILSSSNFLKYEWGLETFMIAHNRVVNGRHDLLIIILKEKMNLDNLPKDLRTYISILLYVFCCDKFELPYFGADNRVYNL